MSDEIETTLTDEQQGFEVRNSYRLLMRDDSVPDLEAVFGDDERAELVLDEIGNGAEANSIWLTREAALKLAELIRREFN